MTHTLKLPTIPIPNTDLSLFSKAPFSNCYYPHKVFKHTHGIYIFTYQKYCKILTYLLGEKKELVKTYFSGFKWNFKSSPIYELQTLALTIE